MCCIPPPPLGVPTPNPALLVQIAPPVASATNVQPSSNVDPVLGAPTTLKWNYPNGAPTPDPALLKGVPDELTWGYPPGVPTPGTYAGRNMI
jgi:hypothetical protein